MKLKLSKLLFAIGLWAIALPPFVYAQIHANNNSTVVTGNQGTVTIIHQTGITLQEHQKAIELEKKNAEYRLRLLHSRKQQSDHSEIVQLKNQIQFLESKLNSIEHEKSILVASLAEYQNKFGSLLSIDIREETLKKFPASDRDIIAIEMSQQSKNAVMSEVLANRDDERLMRIVEVLVRDTESIDDDERKYWKKNLPTINFEQRFRFLDILATERLKLADLERKYQVEIKELNEKHVKEWADFQARKKTRKGSSGSRVQ